MGPSEKLVMEAWGTGIRIDKGDKGEPSAQSNALLGLIDRARAIDTYAPSPSPELPAWVYGLIEGLEFYERASDGVGMYARDKLASVPSDVRAWARSESGREKGR